jgi:hypothetical protein
MSLSNGRCSFLFIIALRIGVFLHDSMTTKNLFNLLLLSVNRVLVTPFLVSIMSLDRTRVQCINWHVTTETRGNFVFKRKFVFIITISKVY